MIEDKTIKINEGERRTGKDEMNLVELPFTLLTRRNPDELKTIERSWIGTGEDGEERKFHKIIAGSDKWGLPTFIGEEVYLACMELSYRQGFKSRKVHASKYEIIKLMDWDYSGASCKRLVKAFNQLAGILITTNAFWDNQEKRYREIGFGIIDDYMFVEEEIKGRKSKHGQTVLPLGNFNWNEIFFKHSLQKGNIKSLDTGLYFSLKSYISKRLYRFADKKLYKQQSFELDLFRLAFEKLEMVGGAYKYPSKIIQNLKPAIQELEERGIVKITTKESKTESGYKVCFNPVSKPQIALPENIETGKNITASEVVQYFHSKITPETKDYTGTEKEIQQAAELLSKHSQEEVKYIIDYALEQAKKTKFEMQYLGAVFNYSDKAIDRAKQRFNKAVKEKVLLVEKKRQERLQCGYERYCQKQIDDYTSQLPEKEYQKDLDEIGEQLSKENPIINNRGSKLFQHLTISSFNQHLIKQGKINILSFDEWVKKQDY